MSSALLAHRPSHDVLAWVQGRAVNVAQLRAHACALAERLPAHGPALNLCQDRYRFTVGLLAALMRGHCSLMPPNALPETVRSLAQQDPHTYALVDEEGARVVALDLHCQVVGAPPEDDVQTSNALGLDSMGALPYPDPALQAVRLLTSGSTGTPTAHGKRWGDIELNIAAEAKRLSEMMGLPDLRGTTLVGTVPPQHSYGLESTVLLALLGGAALESGRPYFPADIVAALQAVPRPRALVTTPFHLKTLLDAGLELPPTDLVLCATAPLSPQLAERAERALQGSLIEIYGCTEAGQVATRRTTEGQDWTAFDGLTFERRSARADGQAPSRDEYWVQGGHVREPTALADVLTLHSPTRFALLGRANDLIHVAGKRSSLAHLNFQLNRVPGVDDGAMWMPPDQADGVTRPVAFVVASHRDAAAVIRGLRGLLEPVFVPRTVVFVDALPRSGTGKVTVEGMNTLAREHGLMDKDSATQAARWNEWRTVPATHPAFDGHFPGQPILPGVVLLGWVQDELRHRPEVRRRLAQPLRIEQLKFLRFVEPGQQVRVRFDDAAADATQLGAVVECRHGEGAGAGDDAAHTAARLTLALDRQRRLGHARAMSSAGSAWTRQQERSSAWALRLLVALARALGRVPVRLLLWPISLYFMLTGAAARRASRAYLSQALGRQATLLDVLRHFHQFACVALDRIWLHGGDPYVFDIQLSGIECLHEVLDSEGGAFLLGAHIGSFDVLQAIGRTRPGMKVAMVMYPDNARMVQGTLAALGARQAPHIITIGRPQATLEIRDWLDDGALVGLLGDRYLAGEDPGRSKLHSLPFLGRAALFSDGPLRLAQLLRRRVVFMVGIYHGGRRYETRFQMLADFRQAPTDRAQREAALADALQRYVACMEAACRTHPLNWFNFFDYWADDDQGSHTPSLP